MPQRESFRRAARLSRGRGEGERLHHYAAVGYGRWLVKCLSVNLSGAPLVSHAGGGRVFAGATTQQGGTGGGGVGASAGSFAALPGSRNRGGGGHGGAPCCVDGGGVRLCCMG